MMRIIVCGSRDYRDEKAVFEKLDSLNVKRGIDLVIHGGARGADLLAGRWATSRGVPVEEFKADWKTHGRGGGPVRNRRMLTEGKPNGVVAFPGENGTSDMVEIARAAGVRVWFPFGRDSVIRRST